MYAIRSYYGQSAVEVLGGDMLGRGQGRSVNRRMHPQVQPAPALVNGGAQALQCGIVGQVQGDQRRRAAGGSYNFV